jgi:adenylate cyclase
MNRITAFIGTLSRNRIFLSTFALAVVAFLSAFTATMVVDHVGVLTSTDNFLRDWEVARLSPVETQDPNIVIVAITEDTLQQFHYRSPIDRGFLARLISGLEAKHPRAIGVDILFDQKTEPDKDEMLRKAILGSPVPIVVAYSNAPNVVTREQLSFLDGYVPPRLRGNVTLLQDEFDTVRAIFPGAPDDQGHFVPGFVRALASDVGVRAPATQVPIIWRGQPSDKKPAFAQYPAETTGFLPAAWFTGKVVLIGVVLSLDDRHRTPFARIYPGGEGLFPGIVIHAHALSQLLEHKSSPRVPWIVDLLVAFILAMIGGALGLLNFHIAARVVAGVVVVVLFWTVAGALFQAANTMVALLSPSLAFAACFSVMDSLSGREARAQRQFIQGAFSRYVSPKVVEALIADPSKMSLQGERREMTYLFTDVADFTTMSEKLDSRTLATLLNSYFDGVTSIVLEHEGMLDKFIGDAVFAIFNAPVDLPSHQAKAVRCGLKIDEFCEKFRLEQRTAGINMGVTRVGIHTGPAVIGNFGSHARFNYTAQGDAVNAASRLEGLNKHFGTHVCVSEATQKACADMSFRHVAAVVLKGKTEAIGVWEPLAEGVMTNGQLERYEAAFACLDAAPDEALALFEALSRELPSDPCIIFYLQRLRSGVNGSNVAMTEK